MSTEALWPGGSRDRRGSARKFGVQGMSNRAGSSLLVLVMVVRASAFPFTGTSPNCRLEGAICTPGLIPRPCRGSLSLVFMLSTEMIDR